MCYTTVRLRVSVPAPEGEAVFQAIIHTARTSLACTSLPRIQETAFSEAREVSVSLLANRHQLTAQARAAFPSQHAFYAGVRMVRRSLAAVATN